MSRSFSIPRSRCAVLSDPGLREEIRAQTGSDSETDSILRSLERFGGDGSIHFYEVTQKPGRRMQNMAKACAWTVHAVR